ncbi:MAG: hypothetical protein EHM48_06995 [Planctomycetaceae bacterium]|nr:MAG: hypothetical protein EHM48_06995 [Planctomycetaceae bacterium]
MKTFKDNEAREWNVEVNVDSVKRVKSLLDVNLADITEDLVKQLSEDPIMLCDVVYVLCKPQADQRNVTDEQFGRSMAGDSIEAAAVALMEELVNFTRNPARRAMWRKVLDKQKRIEAMGVETVEQYIDSDKLDKLLQEKLVQVINERVQKSMEQNPTPST